MVYEKVPVAPSGLRPCSREKEGSCGSPAYERLSSCRMSFNKRSRHFNMRPIIFQAFIIRTRSHARDPNVAQDIDVAVFADHLFFALSCMLRSHNGVAL